MARFETHLGGKPDRMYEWFDAFLREKENEGIKVA